MKIVYHAENGMDASLVKDLLSSAGIHAEVRGTALQGAVGEAPAMNNVKSGLDSKIMPKRVK